MAPKKNQRMAKESKGVDDDPEILGEALESLGFSAGVLEEALPDSGARSSGDVPQEFGQFVEALAMGLDTSGAQEQQKGETAGDAKGERGKEAGEQEQNEDAAETLSELKTVILSEPGERRFPNIVVSTRGTLIAGWGAKTVHVRRSEDAGETWGPPIFVAAGIHGGGLTVDGRSGAILAFVESKHPPAEKLVFRSEDDGKTWAQVLATFEPDCRGNQPDLHMNEHGITLSNPKFAGRLLRAARQYAGENYGDNGSEENWPNHYANAVYSDDGGKTWQTSQPVPGFGFGEAAVVELADGTIRMNLRRHWAPKGVRNTRRWNSMSSDGGETWSTPVQIDALPDGPQNTMYGLMGGFANSGGWLFFSNVDSGEGRSHGHVWASPDEGQTWPIKREICASIFEYSSLAACDSDSDRWIYCLFEGDCLTFCKFSCSWLLEGSSI